MTNKLQKENAELRTENNLLKASAFYKSNIELTKKVGELESEVAELRTENAMLKASALSKANKVLSRCLNDLRETVTVLRGKVSELEAEVKESESQVDQLVSRAEDNQVLFIANKELQAEVETLIREREYWKELYFKSRGRVA